jgi:hypothetical protein
LSNQFSWALRGRLRRDGAIVLLTDDQESPLLEAIAREWLVKHSRLEMA